MPYTEFYVKTDQEAIKPSLFESVKPSILYICQLSESPGWYQNWHHHPFFELYYVYGGRGRVFIDENEYQISIGDILICNTNTRHKVCSDREDPIHMVHCGILGVKKSNLPEGCLIHPNAVPVVHAQKYRQRIENYFAEILSELTSRVIGYTDILESLCLSILVVISRIVEGNFEDKNELNAGGLLDDESNHVTLKIKKFIEENYTKDISLEQISRTFFLSRNYLSHVFKERIGSSPINYMIELRVNEAKKLLVTTSKSISEISCMVGYDDANYFSILFKKYTGLSPRQYRRKNGIDINAQGPGTEKDTGE